MELGNPFTFQKNGKIIIKDSVLENIDTLTEEELKEVLIRFKDTISEVATSIYIPSISLMNIIREYAPNMKVRFKTEKSGGTPILPISSTEFFEGEAYFSQILSGVNSSWTDLQKYKYLYNQLGMMLSYDLNLLPNQHFSSLHDGYARNIFTSISKNWGVCASFAASYDYLCYRLGLESTVVSEEEHDYVVISPEEEYLTDVTFDSVALKFGMKTNNFGISKEAFIKNGHHLEETEIANDDFDCITDLELEQLDRSTGYLDHFDGTYTDQKIIQLIDHLEGNTKIEKIEQLLDKIKSLKTVGRPTLHDYETLLHYVLSNSKELEGIYVFTTLLEENNLSSRTIIVEVEGQQLEFIPNTNYQKVS